MHQSSSRIHPSFARVKHDKTPVTFETQRCISPYDHDSKPNTEISSTVWLRPEASVHATWHSVDTSDRNHAAIRHKSCTIVGSRNRQSSEHRCQNGLFRQSYNPVSTIRPPFHPHRFIQPLNSPYKPTTALKIPIVKIPSHRQTWNTDEKLIYVIN